MGKMKKFGDEDTAEEKATRLVQANQLLFRSMGEMSTYIAKQEKAIMELSTLIADGLKGGNQNV